MIRKLDKNLPWPNTVAVDQGVERDRLEAKFQVIEMFALRTQIDLDIAHRIVGGKLIKINKNYSRQVKTLISLCARLTMRLNFFR